MSCSAVVRSNEDQVLFDQMRMDYVILSYLMCRKVLSASLVVTKTSAVCFGKRNRRFVGLGVVA